MILTIGDAIIDETIELETVRPCPEGKWPIVKEVKRYTRPGGACAVDAMVIAEGELCQLIVATIRRTTKTRTLLDGVPVYRQDDDKDSGFARDAANKIFVWDYTPDVVLIADYGKGAIDRSVIQACLDRGWRVIVDPHPSQNPQIYKGTFAICPNRTENQKHGYAMRGKEFPRFCYKLDKDGMLAFDYGKQKRYKSTAIQPIVDCCGAGDQVLASLGVAVANGADWFEACKVANEAAGRQCGVFGAVPVPNLGIYGG